MAERRPQARFGFALLRNTRKNGLARRAAGAVFLFRLVARQAAFALLRCAPPGGRAHRMICNLLPGGSPIRIT
jgi:hypothetical protein